MQVVACLLHSACARKKGEGHLSLTLVRPRSRPHPTSYSNQTGGILVSVRRVRSALGLWDTPVGQLLGLCIYPISRG